MKNKWVNVKDKLPICSSKDDKFDGCFYEEEFAVLINGKESKSSFWACWEETKHIDEPENFIMEFDEDGVTHWKELKD